MTLGLAGVSYMSVSNDFDETVIYDQAIIHGRILDNISLVKIDSTTVENYDSTLGTGTNDLRNDTGAHTNLYSGQLEGAFALCGNSIDTGNITANISNSKCDHESCVEDELLSNCDTKVKIHDQTRYNSDTKKKVDDETDSNCDTCLVEEESVRLCGMNSIYFDFVNHDYTCQPLCLENDFCDIDSVQDSTFEDMMSHSGSNKPSEFQKI